MIRSLLFDRYYEHNTKLDRTRTLLSSASSTERCHAPWKRTIQPRTYIRLWRLPAEYQSAVMDLLALQRLTFRGQQGYWLSNLQILLSSYDSPSASNQAAQGSAFLLGKRPHVGSVLQSDLADVVLQRCCSTCQSVYHSSITLSWCGEAFHHALSVKNVI
jgi:hypothetical protein